MLEKMRYFFTKKKTMTLRLQIRRHSTVSEFIPEGLASHVELPEVESGMLDLHAPNSP